MDDEIENMCEQVLYLSLSACSRQDSATEVRLPLRSMDLKGWDTGAIAEETAQIRSRGLHKERPLAWDECDPLKRFQFGLQKHHFEQCLHPRSNRWKRDEGDMKGAEGSIRPDILIAVHLGMREMRAADY